MKSLQGKGYEFWINRQVIREYLVVKSRFMAENNKFDAKELAEDIKVFESQYFVADENQTTTNLLLNLIGKYKVSGKKVHDCNITATMLENAIPEILTNNIQDFVQYESEINIIGLE